MSEGVEVSVVLPAYNEEDTIERTVEVTLSTLADFLPAGSFEVIVAEDGCDDRTPEIATRMAEDDERVRHIHSDERLGRGGALEYAFRRAEGETLVYFDTDLATDMFHLEELVESIRSGEYDVATGSRWIPGEAADRPAKRGIPSRGFNTMVRLVLRSDVKDHQCGFKAFDRETLLALMDDVEDDHWFWDTEVLVRAQREGYRVKEFAVDWTPKGDSKVDLVRDVFGMGSQIVRTFWQLSVAPRIDRRVSIAAGTGLVLVALLLMTTYLDLGEVWAEIRSADPALIGLSAVVYVLSWPLRGVRYRDILAELGYPSETGFLTGAIFISQTGNLVFPARLGDGVRAYVMKARRSVPYPSGFASLAVERVFDLLTIAILAGVVILGMLVTMSPAELQAAITGVELGGNRELSGERALLVAAGVAAAAVVATVVIVASARSDRNYVRETVSRLSSDSYADYVAGVIESFVGDIQTVASDRRAFAVVGASSLLIWTLDVLTAVVVLAAFGVELTAFVVGVAFFAVSVGNLAKVLPLTPAGLGLYEGAFAVIVVGLTPVGAALAISVAIVDHAVKNVVTLAGGLVSMAWLNVSLTTAVEESEAHSASADERGSTARE
ncbi:flippase-like domain-containing protein [Halapricum sp. CBA1109]|uniref:flippase-like domain-containing protein n=1 Tax=Halapricum sp. CBA1109 TaxID=2668068 RepID=UPI0012FB25B0|nr:flippase-like domain-containing protein [Halapricum sp. CBA1109]MUV90786.1 flippase-like domain-containing protein [Halapricum sp. CBA1109]